LINLSRINNNYLACNIARSRRAAAWNSPRTPECNSSACMFGNNAVFFQT